MSPVSLSASLRSGPPPVTDPAVAASLTPADRWMLSRTQRLVRRVTTLMEQYEYASAKNEIETFTWGELADNYLEMCKQRLYDPAHPAHLAACAALAHVLHVLIKLLAPFMPYVTEEIYQGLFAHHAGQIEGDQKALSIHTSPWPEALPGLEDDNAERTGGLLVEIATAARRFKSEHNLSLGTELRLIQLAFVTAPDDSLMDGLVRAEADLKSITRARQIAFASAPDPAAIVADSGSLAVEIFLD